MLLGLLLITAQLRYVSPSTESTASLRGPGAPAATRGRRQPTCVKGATLTLASLVGVGARVGMGVGVGLGVGIGEAMAVGAGVGVGSADGVGAGVSEGIAPGPVQAVTNKALATIISNQR